MSAADYRRQVERAMTEKTFQAQVMQLARLNGWKAYHAPPNVIVCPTCKRKVYQQMEPGLPDCIFIKAPRVIWAELKREKGGKFSADQQFTLAALEAAGQEVYRWRPSDWAQIVAVLEGAAEGRKVA